MYVCHSRLSLCPYYLCCWISDRIMLILSSDNVNRCSVKMVRRIQQYASCPVLKLSKSQLCCSQWRFSQNPKVFSLTSSPSNTFHMKCGNLSGILSNRKEANKIKGDTLGDYRAEISYICVWICPYVIESPEMHFWWTMWMGPVSVSVCTNLAITFSPADKQILALSDILVSLWLLLLAGSVLCVFREGAREYVQARARECVRGKEQLSTRTFYIPKMTWEKEKLMLKSWRLQAPNRKNTLDCFALQVLAADLQMPDSSGNVRQYTI